MNSVQSQSTQPSTEVQTPANEPSEPSMAPFVKALVNPQNAILKRTLKAPEELERLTTETFYNPFDILHLGIEATDEDLKKMYRSFSMILHPDKCKDPRATDAFHTIDSAYKLLQDAEKRKVYVRIMREAREKTEYERVKENKRRQKQGLPPLPGIEFATLTIFLDDTFEIDFKRTCRDIFMEIEDRRQHLMRLESSQKKQKIEEYERRKMLEQYKVLTDQEWEDTRDQRVNKWRDFSNQKKSSIGTKMSDKVCLLSKLFKGIRPPPVKMEQRSFIPRQNAEQRKAEEEQLNKM